MPTAIVFAAHGSPPLDFPKKELSEFFSLHDKQNRTTEETTRFKALESKMLNHFRNEQNDPYFFATYDIAKNLERKTEMKVFVGFNEFCKPTISEAIDKAVESGNNVILIVTPMLTRGGSHAEKDIPEIIDKCQNKYLNVTFTYVWPFNPVYIAEFLHQQIKESIQGR